MPETYGHLGWRQARARSGRAVPQVRSQEGLEATSSFVARLTYLVIVLYALAFSGLSVLRHESFQTNAFDLGNMDQAVWNTAQGRWFQFTNEKGVDTRLALHVEPILVPIALLYRLWSGPPTLLVLQSVVLALGALPAFWLARSLLKNDFAGFAFASAYLLAPALEAANLADFHPVSLSASFLLFAFYFLQRRWYPLFLLFAILAMATKEQVPLSIALVGLYLLVGRKQRWWGAATILLALGWVAVAFLVVLPAFNPGGISPFAERYAHLLQPGGLEKVATDPVRWAYLQGLLEPVAYLSLLSPHILAVALPDIAVNFFSGFPATYSGSFHYNAVIVPFIIISAAMGAAWVYRRLAAFSPRLGQGSVYLLALAVLFFSLRSYYRWVLLPVVDHFPVMTTHERMAAKLFSQIPAEAALATSSSLNPHLSQRQRLSVFPEIRDAAYIALDVTTTPYPLDVPSLKWRVDQLLQGGAWGIIDGFDGYLLLGRGVTNRHLPEAFFSFVRIAEPRLQYPLEARFGEGLQFLGYTLRPGAALHGIDPFAQLTLYWKVLSPMKEDYRMVLFLLAPEGRVLSFFADSAATTWYPTSRWRVGETIAVRVPRVAWDGTSEADLYLGVITADGLRDPSQRLRPQVLHLDPRIALNGDGTLLYLTRLRRE